jgi:hypothetical protein
MKRRSSGRLLSDGGALRDGDGEGSPRARLGDGGALRDGDGEGGGNYAAMKRRSSGLLLSDGGALCDGDGEGGGDYAAMKRRSSGRLLSDGESSASPRLGEGGGYYAALHVAETKLAKKVARLEQRVWVKSTWIREHSGVGYFIKKNASVGELMAILSTLKKEYHVSLVDAYKSKLTDIQERVAKNEDVDRCETMCICVCPDVSDM